jgi:hypothetical protein
MVKFCCGSKGNEDGFMGWMPGYGQKAIYTTGVNISTAFLRCRPGADIHNCWFELSLLAIMPTLAVTQ